MKKINLVLMLFLLISTWSQAQKVAAYFPSYRSGVVNSMQWNKLTDVYYAFINADANGNLITSNPSDAVFGFDAITFDAVKAKCSANGVRLHISVGGADVNYQRAARMKTISRNSTALNTFATQIVNYAISNGLAGINLDWEFPNESIGGQGGNITDHYNLVKAVKDKIAASSKPSLTLGAAVGGEWFGTFRHTNYISSATGSNTVSLLDEFHIMAYDIPAGGGATGLPYSPVHHAAVADVATCLQEWNLQKGVPYSKMLVGIPFYGRTSSRGTGNDVDNMYINFSASNPASAYQDADGLFNNWYYDSKTQIDLKIQDAVGSKGCQGAFVWDLGQDRTDQYSLISAIKAKMDQICPIPDPNLGPDQGFCSGSVTLNPQVPTAANRTFTWQKDGVNITGFVNSTTANTYSTNQPGTYKVIIKQGTQGSCQKEDQISVVSGSSFTASGATRCGSGSVTLNVNSSTGTYDWYDAAVGGSKLLTGGSGNNFGRSYSTNVTGTTDFFIQVNNGSQDYNTGKTAFDNAPNAAWNERGINDGLNKPRFAQKLTLFTDVTLKSVKIYKPSGVNVTNAKIIIYKSNGSTIHAITDSVNLAGTTTVYNFNANIALQGSVAGTVYYIGVWSKTATGGSSTNPGFYLDRNAPAVDYTQAGVFTLQKECFVSFSGDFGINGSLSTGNYGQLFDIVLTTGVPDPCGRVKVTATVNPGADISKTAVAQAYKLCPTDDAVVKILASESGALYQVVKGTSNVGSPVQGTGSDITLTVPNNVLVGGANSFNVNVSKIGCGASPLTDTVGFDVTSFPNVTYTASSAQSVCPGATATVSLSGSQSGRSYQVYINNVAQGTAVQGTNSAINLSFTAPQSSGNATAVVKVISGTCLNDITDTATVKVSTPVASTINYQSVNKTYGDADFNFTASSNSSTALSYSITNGSTFATIDPVSGLVKILGAGVVNVRASQSASGCFAATTKDATITIGKKTLSATADPKTKVFNTANPTLTFTYSGFVGADNSSVIDAAPSIATTATTTSNVGSYPITLSGGSDNNYNITNVNSTLNITKATRTIQITSANAGFTTKTITVTAVANPSSSNISFSVANGTGTATLSGTTLSLVTEGTVTLTASVVNDPNYFDVSTNQVITITRITDVKDQNLSNATELKVYPNPIQDDSKVKLVLTNSGSTSLDVINSLGVVEQSLLHEVNLSAGTYEFELSGLSSGVYLIRLSTKDGVTTKKVVKN